MIRITDKPLSAAAELSELAGTDAPLFDACVKRFRTDDLLSFTVNSALSWNNPNNLRLLENDAYRDVIEKYGKR